MRRFTFALFTVLVVPAANAPAADRVDPSERAAARVESLRRALGLKPLPTTLPLPGGTLRVAGAEQLAARPGAELRLDVTLDRPAAGAALLVTLPGRFTRTAASGLRFAGVPRLRGAAGGRARLRQAGRTLTLDLGEAQVGDVASLAIDVAAMTPGTHALALRWREAGGATRAAGTARLRLYARSREEAEAGEERNPWRTLRAPSVETNSSSDTGEESETFIVASPLDQRRILSAGNAISGDAKDAFISNDGGRTFTGLALPTVTTDVDVDGDGSNDATVQAMNVSTPSGIDQEIPGGDPIMAADDLGNLWLGGLSTCTNAAEQGRIFVNRIPAGANSFSPISAGLRFLVTGNFCDLTPSGQNIIQDKPMMTIDNAPSSPTYGRLYVTWDSLSSTSPGAVDVVISACDTRPGGLPKPECCDLGINWSVPAVVSGPTSGAYITSDVAVGPDGRVYVVWWDYDANNAIRITRCSAPPNCLASGAWDGPRNLAVLNSTGGQLPFACPILAQPGGRAAPVPSIEVDHSGGPEHGTIYVGWADLRENSGTTRCADTTPGTAPAASHRTFDAFVASSKDYDVLTAGAGTASSARGTSVVGDTATGPADANNSDDFLSWVAVDQSTGEAWTDTYTTKGDATRKATDFYLRKVTPTGTTQVSFPDPAVDQNTGRSDYSDKPCCDFGNDYGDYTGLAAAEGQPFPVWTQRTPPGDGDVFLSGIAGPGPHLVHETSTLVEGTGADGDGFAEPGENFVLTEKFKNAGDASQTNVVATALTSSVPGVAVADGASSYGNDVSAGTSATNATPFTGALAATVPCETTVDFRMTLSTGEGPRTIQFPARVSCLPAAPTPTPPPSSGTGPAPVPDTTGPVVVLGTPGSTRLTRTGFLSIPLGPFSEDVRGTISYVTAKAVRPRRGATPRVLQLGSVPYVALKGARLQVRKRISSRNLRAVKFLRKVTVRATVTAFDTLGNRSVQTVTFRLLAPRKQSR